MKGQSSGPAAELGEIVLALSRATASPRWPVLVTLLTSAIGAWQSMEPEAEVRPLRLTGAK